MFKIFRGTNSFVTEANKKADKMEERVEENIEENIKKRREY